MFDGLEQLPAGQRRLLRLADRLDDLNPKRFSLRNWAEAGSCIPSLDQEEQPACGTVCCAVGYAALLPEFVVEGLVLSEKGGPFFQGHADWAAVRLFFEIEDFAATRMFLGSYYKGNPKPSDVAARLREYVAGTMKVAVHA